MMRVIIWACCMCLALPVSAQQQQAGNAASTDTDGTFQALLDACDDVDALMLRARIRLQLPRTTDAASAEAESMLEQGFARCGAGDLAGAKTQLSEALAIASEGVTEQFEPEIPAVATQTEVVSIEEQGDKSGVQKQSDSAWWKFWQ